MEEEDEGEVAPAGGIDECRGLDTDDTGDTRITIDGSELEELLIVLNKRLIIQNEQPGVVVARILIN